MSILRRLLRLLLLMAAGENVVVTSGKFGLIDASGKAAIMNASDECDECCVTTISGCDDCDSGTAPIQYQVVMAGVTDNNCEDCDNYNATFILDEIGPVGIHDCYWRFTDPDASCPGTESEADIEINVIPVDVSPNVFIEVQARHEPGATVALWRTATDSPTIDCCNKDAEDVPLFSSFTATRCDFSVATAELTSLGC